MLGLTNANNNTADTDDGVLATIENYARHLVDDLKGGSNENSTANESSNATDTSIFHKPKNMSDVRAILLAFLRVIAQLFIIVSC